MVRIALLTKNHAQTACMHTNVHACARTHTPTCRFANCSTAPSPPPLKNNNRAHPREPAGARHANGKHGGWSDWHSQDIFQQDKLSKLRTFEQQGTAKRHYIFTFQVIWLCTAEFLTKLSKEKTTLTIEPSVGLHLVRREGNMRPSVPDLATFPTFPLLSFLECKHFECREELGSGACSEQFPALWALRTFFKE